MAKRALDVSVIICAYTEARWHELVAAVKSLHAQSKPPREIIVVVDHNPGLLQRSRAELAGVVVVENKEAQGLSGARNSGIAIARGALLAYLDDDATAEPDWLLRLCSHFEDSRVLGVGGTVIPAWTSSAPRWFPRQFNWVVGCSYQDLPERPIAVRNPFGGCACYRREMFATLGGFRTGIGRGEGALPLGCEETELCIRARQRWPQKIFLYEPRARIHHHIPPARASWRYFSMRCFAEGLSKAAVAQLVGSKDGLSTERTYVVKTLSINLMRGMLRGILCFDGVALAQAGAIVVGLTCTVAGYAVGVIRRYVAQPQRYVPGRYPAAKQELIECMPEPEEAWQ
jgi:glucosyl-dolichyl phosphate glucuronosyltransferase